MGDIINILDWCLDVRKDSIDCCRHQEQSYTYKDDMGIFICYVSKNNNITLSGISYFSHSWK